MAKHLLIIEGKIFKFNIINLHKYTRENPKEIFTRKNEYWGKFYRIFIGENTAVCYICTGWINFRKTPFKEDIWVFDIYLNEIAETRWMTVKKKWEET